MAITNKQNLIKQLATVQNLLNNEEIAETKMIVESLFALEQMVNLELQNRLCCKKVFKAISI
jgi:hypothetical protein